MSEGENLKHAAREFLLSEFAALQERAIAKEEVKSNRINFYLVIVAAIIAGSSVVLESDRLQLPLKYGLLLATSMILIIGITTLDQVIKYSVEVILFYRLAGRVRRYFVDFCEEITPYVAFDPTDSRPRLDIGASFIALRGGDAVLLSVNALALSVLASVIANLLLEPINFLVYLILAGLAFILGWVLQIIRIRVMLRDAEGRFTQRIHFPIAESHDDSST